MPRVAGQVVVEDDLAGLYDIVTDPAERGRGHAGDVSRRLLGAAVAMGAGTAYLQVDAGNCEARCREKLYAMRQIRLAQGKDMVRLERLWLLSDDSRPAPDLLAEYEGTLVVRAAGSEALAALPAPADSTAHLYVVDPRGNLMMRFPEKPDPTRMIKDLQRLLRPSRIGAG